MRAKKMHLISLVCASALVTATACSNTTGTGTTGGTSASGTSSACKGSDPIPVGLLVPLTGPNAKTAKYVENVTKLAADQINAAGTLGSRKIDVKIYDTQFKPELATQHAQRAITQDSVAAIIGPWATTEALAVADVVEREQMVDINNSAATPTITAGKKFVFRTSPLTNDLAAGLVDVAMALKVPDAVLMFESGGFGQGAVEPIKAAAKAKGFNVKEFVQFTTSATDVSAEVATVARSKPGAVLLASSAGADSGLIGKAMVEQGLNVPFIGFSPISLPDAVQISGGAYDKLPGVYTLSTADNTNPLNQKLLTEYNAKFEKLEQFPEQVLGSFDAMSWIAKGLAVTGCEAGAPLAKALEGLPAQKGANGRSGSEQKFGADKHDALSGKYLVPYKMKAGQPVQDTALAL